MADRVANSARAKRALALARKRPPANAEPLIERLVFRCIVGLAVASVAAVLFLSVVGASP